jgi:hypothetical protein
MLGSDAATSGPPRVMELARSQSHAAHLNPTKGAFSSAAESASTRRVDPIYAKGVFDGAPGNVRNKTSAC